MRTNDRRSKVKGERPKERRRHRAISVGAFAIALCLLLIVALAGPTGCERSEATAEKVDTVTIERGKLTVWVAARGKVGAESNFTISPPPYWGQLKIEKLAVKEGDKVSKGDVLIELNADELEENVRDIQRDIRSAEGARQSAEAQLRSERDRLEADVRKAREDLAKARKALDELLRLPLETDRRNAEIDLETARKSAGQAEARYESMKKLYEGGGGVSLQQLEQRELEFRSAETQLKRATLEYELIKAGAGAADVRAARILVELADVAVKQAERTRDLTLGQLEEALKKTAARVEQNRSNLTRTQRTMDCCTIRAPVDGTVFYGRVGTHEGQEKITEGMEVRFWDRLMELPDTSRMQIKVEVDEKDVGKVAKGQEARITLDAYRRQKYTGKVTAIEPVTRRKGGRQRGRESDAREDVGSKVVDVVVTFDRQDDLVRTGLNGRAEIRTEMQSEGLLVPIGALFSAAGRDVVYRVEQGRLAQVVVVPGERSDTHVLILEGLKEGDVVSLVDPNAPGAKGGGR